MGASADPGPPPAAGRGGSASGRPCPRCRADNPYERRLCLRCGAELATANPSSGRRQLPWWRRLFGRDPDRVLVAGSRPRHRTWSRPRLALPLTLLVLLGAAYFARSQLSDALTFTQDRTGTPEALRPEAGRASSEAAGHRAGAAFDGFTNRYWAPAETGPATGQYLETTFEKPVRLRKLLVIAGGSVNQDEFLAQARPAELTVTLFDARGERTTQAVNLRDQPGQQTFDVRGSDVSRVRVTIDAAYGGSPKRRVAIAELEFFGRR
ncbi:NADase-type glycan-binding domain-containing protein [Streptomyces sp. NPDC057702]|uniref:NADase-type glycan-binding domain-containing protein n=1 Tax=Streptomyces sp. NPDC057702 TaxID=3346221 RepID=UPI003674CB6B